MDLKVFIWIGLLGVLATGLQAMPLDSLGIEVKNGKPYVLHRVESKETLFSISQRYHCKVKDIKTHNNLNSSNLSLGEVLEIPWSGPLTHLVKAGETLYSISRIYGISVEDLRAWNHLEQNELEVSAKLRVSNVPSPSRSNREQMEGEWHVVQPKETLYSISKAYGVTVKQIRIWNQLSDSKVNIGDTLAISNESEMPKPTEESINEPEETEIAGDEEIASNSKNKVYVPAPVNKPARTTTGNAGDPANVVKQTGIAAVFDDDDTKRYLALHRTAPVGTIMQIRNEMTNLAVFVRVVGKLPDTGVNQNVIIRLSKAAQEGLGALDNKFRVQLSYIPAH